MGSQSSTSSFHGTATPLDETQQSAITSDRSDKSHESSGEDDDDDDDDQKTGGALLASKLDKLSGEYLQREINAQNASRKVQIQDKRSVQAGREAAAAKRRMTLADMMGAANIAHMLRRKQQKEKSVQRTAKKKGKSSNYIYFDGELVRFEDVPEHLRDMIPKVYLCYTTFIDVSSCLLTPIPITMCSTLGGKLLSRAYCCSHYQIHQKHY